MGRASVLILAAVLTLTCVSALTRVEIMLSGRDLPDEDICCSPPVYPPDTYAVVHYAPSNRDDYNQYGKTSVLSNNHDPNWSETFSFNIEDRNSTARIKVELWDSDVDDDDFMGFAEVNLSEVVNAFGHVVDRYLTAPKGNGRLIVTGRINGTFFQLPEQRRDSQGVRLHYKGLESRQKTE